MIPTFEEAECKCKHNANRCIGYGIDSALTEEQWIDVCTRYDGKCAECGTDAELTIEHIIPLWRGGTDWIGNIEPLCKQCNNSRNAVEMKRLQSKRNKANHRLITRDQLWPTK